MRIQLLEPHQGLKAGATWNCPWATVAQKLIASGKAVALEECDMPAEIAANTDQDETAQGEAEETKPPKAKPKKRK